jgi:hypothetical protein
MEPFYSDPREAARVLYEYLIVNPDNLDFDSRKLMLDMLAPMKPISDAIVESAEIFYARKEIFAQPAASVGAMLASTATLYNINNYAAADEGARGNGISAALRRHAGEEPPVGVTWPPPEEDPVPKDIYLPPPDSGKVDFIPPPAPGTGSVPAPMPNAPMPTQRPKKDRVE